METDDRITVILAYLRGDVAEIYAQKKLDKLDEELGIQDWDNFMKEIKTTFSNKIKAADAKWRIESFQQGKQNTTNFMIEFNALVKIVNDGLYFIFSFHFILPFFSFSFSIFRTTRVRVYQSHCHINHKLMAQSQD